MFVCASFSFVYVCVYLCVYVYVYVYECGVCVCVLEGKYTEYNSLKQSRINFQGGHLTVHYTGTQKFNEHGP